MRRRDQRRAEESGGGGREWATSRWTVLCAGRGGGERVHERGATTEDATYGRGIRIVGNENIQKIVGDRWGGRVIITCVIIDEA